MKYCTLTVSQHLSNLKGNSRSPCLRCYLARRNRKSSENPMTGLLLFLHCHRKIKQQNSEGQVLLFSTLLRSLINIRMSLQQHEQTLFTWTTSLTTCHNDQTMHTTGRVTNGCNNAADYSLLQAVYTSHSACIVFLFHDNSSHSKWLHCRKKT